MDAIQGWSRSLYIYFSGTNPCLQNLQAKVITFPFMYQVTSIYLILRALFRYIYHETYESYSLICHAYNSFTYS